MNIPEFVAKWKSSTLTERSSAQSWFTDLCAVLGYPTPTDVDVDGETYTFERGATKTGGGNGWADVWMRGHFAWEFKGKHANDLHRSFPIPMGTRHRTRLRPARDGDCRGRQGTG